MRGDNLKRKTIQMHCSSTQSYCLVGSPIYILDRHTTHMRAPGHTFPGVGRRNYSTLRSNLMFKTDSSEGTGPSLEMKTGSRQYFYVWRAALQVTTVERIHPYLQVPHNVNRKDLLSIEIPFQTVATIGGGSRAHPKNHVSLPREAIEGLDCGHHGGVDAHLSSHNPQPKHVHYLQTQSIKPSDPS